MNALRIRINPLLLLLLALPVLASVVGADDPHPLHGTWISEQEPDGDDSGVELVFHRDGTFRMTVEVEEDFDENEFDEDEFEDEDESWEDILADVDSNGDGVIDEEDYRAQVEGLDSWEDVLAVVDSNGDGVLDEEDNRAAQERGDEFALIDAFEYEEGDSWEDILYDIDSNDNGAIDEEEYNSWIEPENWDDILVDYDSNGDGVIEQEEFEEDNFDEGESWEDILSDIDSNDNGVIDEEDYLAAQESGDEDLPESWDEVLEADINGDGVIDEEEWEEFEVDGGDWEEFNPFAGEEEIVMTTVLTGTWEAQGDQVILESDGAVIMLNDMTIAEYYTAIFDAMFDAMFEESGLGEDEFMAMISEEDDTITAETLDELKADTVDQIVVFFAGIMVDFTEEFGFGNETFDYEIDDHEMIATDSSGEPLSFVRLDAESAVEDVSWGQIKATMSR